MPAYKDSKKNTWYVKFRYTDWQGNRKETTRRGFATKREAKEYEQEYMYDFGVLSSAISPYFYWLLFSILSHFFQKLNAEYSPAVKMWSKKRPWPTTTTAINK